MHDGEIDFTCDDMHELLDDHNSIESLQAEIRGLRAEIEALQMLARRAVFNYDAPPPTGEKILILTQGNICMVGYRDSTDKAWAPLPKRDKDRERELGLLGPPHTHTQD